MIRSCLFNNETNVSKFCHLTHRKRRYSNSVNTWHALQKSNVSHGITKLLLIQLINTPFYDKLDTSFPSLLVASSCNPASWRLGLVNLATLERFLQTLCTEVSVNPVTIEKSSVTRLSDEQWTGSGRQHSSRRNYCYCHSSKHIEIVSSAEENHVI